MAPVAISAAALAAFVALLSARPAAAGTTSVSTRRASTTTTSYGTRTTTSAAASASLKAPEIPLSLQYLERYDQSVYENTEAFCNDWDSSCVEYLSSFSDIHQVICDAGAAGPDVHVYCGGNTVAQENKFFDFSNNVQRFVSASLIEGPSGYGEEPNVVEDNVVSCTHDLATHDNVARKLALPVVEASHELVCLAQQDVDHDQQSSLTLDKLDSRSLHSLDLNPLYFPAKPTSHLSEAARAAIVAANEARKHALAHLKANRALAERRLWALARRKKAELHALVERRKEQVQRARRLEREREEKARKVAHDKLVQAKGKLRAKKLFEAVKKGLSHEAQVEARLEAKLGKETVKWLEEWLEKEVEKDVKELLKAHSSSKERIRSGH
ncbi:hypothetical protein JCM10296v2_002685 [Rhodotorula toruloides]